MYVYDYEEGTTVILIADECSGFSFSATKTNKNCVVVVVNKPIAIPITNVVLDLEFRYTPYKDFIRWLQLFLLVIKKSRMELLLSEERFSRWNW